MRALAALLLVCAACAQANETGPDAEVDARAIDATPIDAPPDAMTSAGFFLDDTAADFMAGTTAESVVEAYGAVAPRTYYTGALRVRGSDNGTFTNAASETWAQVQAMTFTGQTGFARNLTVDWGTGAPTGVGLTSGDDLTLAYEGDLYLEPGMWTFYLLADEHGFLELLPPGATTYVRIASANWPTESSGTFSAPVAGWYPIRIAHCEQTGAAQLKVEMSGPTMPARGPISRQRLRFLASDQTGLAATAFDDSHLLGDARTTIDHAAPAGVAWNTGFPGDLGLTGGDDFSMRWSGQLRIDVAGDYTFRYVSDDGQRLWIDGALVLDQLDDAAHDATTSPIHLEPGWHPIVIDHSEATGTAQAFLGVSAGPDLVGQALPVDHLRPAEARSERYDGGADHTDRAIPDLGTAESTVVIDAPPGAKTDGVDVGWVFDHTYQSDVEISLVAPDGSVSILRDHAGGAASGTVTQRMHVTSLDQSTANGTWRLRVRDTVSLDSGTLRDFELTVHHQSGQPPVSLTAAYDSSVKDLGEMVTAYPTFSWSARADAHTLVRVLARSGDTESAVMSAPWSTPMVDPTPQPPPVTPRRFFQYRIELDSDGDGSASVDWVRLDTTREIP